MIIHDVHVYMYVHILIDIYQFTCIYTYIYTVEPNLTTYMLLLKSFMSQGMKKNVSVVFILKYHPFISADGSILYSIIKCIEENPELLSINEFTDGKFI